MPFDPTKSDAERVYDAVQDRFEDAWVELFDNHGQKTLKVEPPQGDEAKERATEIEAFLNEKGLRTQRNKLSERGDPDIYEITATTDGW